MADEEAPPTVKIEELVAAFHTNTGPSKMQWVAVVGVGTVLIMGIVPWMMWMISEVIPANTKALVAIESQSKDVETELARGRKAVTKLSALLQDDEDFKIETKP